MIFNEQIKLEWEVFGCLLSMKGYKNQDGRES